MGVIQIEYINSCGKTMWVDSTTTCVGNCTPTPTTPTIAASSLSICGSETSTLTAAGGNGTITWYRNGSPLSNTGTTLSVSGQGGVYKAKSITTCGEGAFSNEVTIGYQATCGCSPTPATPTISANYTSVCGTNTATLSAIGGNGVYRWYRNGVFFAQGATANVNTTGQYTATTLTTCGESVASNSITITNTGACPSNFAMTVGTITTVC